VLSVAKAVEADLGTDGTRSLAADASEFERSRQEPLSQRAPPLAQPLKVFVPDEAQATPSSADPVPLAATHSVRWDWIADPERDLLFGDQSPGSGLPLPQWSADGRLSVVKHGPHRTVYRLTSARPATAAPASPTSAAPPAIDTWFIKRFRGGGWIGLLRDRCFGTRAEREFRAARAIAELGIPTIEPVLLGRVPAGLWTRGDQGTAGDSWLATRGIVDGQPLDEFVEGHAAAFSGVDRHEFRRWLANTLGRVVARLHRAGVRHPDLHAGNLLVTGPRFGDSVRSETVAPIPRWTLWLIDLHAVRLNTRLSEGARRRNVAELHRFFAPWSTKGDRARFRAAYLEELAPHRTSRVSEIATRSAWERELASAVETGRMRADKAWRRGNRHVRRTRMGAGDYRAVATLSRDTWNDWIAGPHAFLESRAVRWCKRGATRRVAEVTLSSAEGTAFLKRIERPGGIKQLTDACTLPVARRAWEIGHQLLRRGVDTPRPLACAVLVEGAVRTQYLLTSAVPESLTLLDWCAELRAERLAPSEQRARWRPRWTGLARALARLHAAGFDHRDLKFQNLLVSRSGPAERVWLLDLDGVRCHGGWRTLPGGSTWFVSRRVQNLARVLASARAQGILCAADALRFLRVYLNRDELRDWKWWWRSIRDRAETKRRRNARRGRPLA
jgi:hypothetical protein